MTVKGCVSPNVCRIRVQLFNSADDLRSDAVWISKVSQLMSNHVHRCSVGRHTRCCGGMPDALPLLLSPDVFSVRYLYKGGLRADAFAFVVTVA